ncbi:alanine--tRNA ligase [Patescibacteria group bacterium]|nr:alanine--tRNA ligase [Patescibacteria group bacterium]
MKSTEIRNRFIDYFTKVLKNKGMEHTEVPSSSLIPESHPTLLFTNSGMVQFTPYFLGEKDPVKDFKNKRLTSCQKCLRTGDLDIVGVSKYHQTYFEMLGNWSVGDYGKSEAVKFSFDLLTNKEYGFGLDATKFYPTVFAGDKDCEQDNETIEAWKSVGIPDERIPRLPASENWWAPGPTGPCGPCTEVLYDRGESFGPEEKTPGLTDNPRYLEIWNAGVFMQFNRDSTGTLTPLPFLSVDTGCGLERMSCLLQQVDSNYETDLFKPIIDKIMSLSNTKLDAKNNDIKFSIQRSADHLRAATFLIADGLHTSNKDQGYVLRQLIRRVYDACVWKLGIDSSKIAEIIPVIIEINKQRYPEIDQLGEITAKINEEIILYNQTADRTRKFIITNFVKKGLNEIKNPFDIRQSLGANRDLIENIAYEQKLKVDFSTFDKELEKHSILSKSNMANRFKGGLGGKSETEIKYHTATHLLHRALREILGTHVGQMGSNITEERLRFDFSHNQKMTEEEIKNVENLVNEKIEEGLPVNQVILKKEEAEKTGALHFFKEKYGDEISIYFIGENLENAWSKEYCGGPHVTNTSEIGKIKIVKEEAVAKGVRRIKAIIEKM